MSRGPIIDTNCTVLAAFTLPHANCAVLQVYITRLQVQGFFDPKSGSRHDRDQGAKADAGIRPRWDGCEEPA
jgi:hypothetical protein